MTGYSTRKFANATYAAENHVFHGAKANAHRLPISIPEARRIAKALGFDLSELTIRRGTSKGAGGYYYPPLSASTAECSTCPRRPCRDVRAAREAVITLGDKCGVWVLLHELAHHLQHTTDVVILRGRGHDYAFRRWYLWLVYRQLGDYWYRRLRTSLVNHELFPRPMVAAR